MQYLKIISDYSVPALHHISSYEGIPDFKRSLGRLESSHMVLKPAVSPRIQGPTWVNDEKRGTLATSRGHRSSTSSKKRKETSKKNKNSRRRSGRRGYEEPDLTSWNLQVDLKITHTFACNPCIISKKYLGKKKNGAWRSNWGRGRKKGYVFAP